MPDASSVGTAFSLGTLVGAASGRCLNAAGTSPANGAELILYTCAGAGNDTWTLTPAGQLYFTVGGISRCIHATGTESGSRVVVGDCSGVNGQKWRLTGDGRVLNLVRGCACTRWATARRT